jgi:hypothetical protein
MRHGNSYYYFGKSFSEDVKPPLLHKTNLKVFLDRGNLCLI